MMELAILIGALLAAVCTLDVRRGLYVTVFVGFIQDPIRKLIPEQPVYVEGFCIAMLAATFFGARMRGVRIVQGPLLSLRRSLRKPLSAFLLVVFYGVVITLLRTRNGVIAGIGIISYLAPLPAILVGYAAAARNPRHIDRFFLWYSCGASVMLTGVYFYFVLGFDWPILAPVGEWLIVYHQNGTMARLLPGFFRASEIAAWHCSAAICFSVIRAVSAQKSRGKLWFAGLMLPYLAVAVVLTGRRKALAEIAIFLIVYVFLLMWFRRSSTRILKIGGVAALAMGLVLQFGLAGKSQLADPYVERSGTLLRDAGERLWLMTAQSLRWVIVQNGFFGVGAGTGSPGSQHYGGGSDLVGGSAEGGAVKVVAELGVPGLVVALWLLWALGRQLWRAMRGMSQSDPIRARMFYGLAAFGAANASVFVTAHQVFGDPLVLLTLGSCLGFAISLVGSQPAQRAPAREASPAAGGVPPLLKNPVPVEIG